jgi:VanZ family protein
VALDVGPGTRSRIGLAAGVWLAVILAATLTPLPNQTAQSAASPWWCVACGDLGAVDLAQNILLFMPLGVALAAGTRRLGIVILIGASLSLGIELLQATLIAGRDASLGDLLANAVGSGLGAALRRNAPALAYPGRAASRWLAAGAGLFALATLAGSAWLLTPSPLPRRAIVSSAPRIALYDRFPGQILEAGASGRAGDSTFGVDATVLSVPPHTRPAVILGAMTSDGEFWTMLSEHRGDVTFTWRTRAQVLRLREPSVTAAATDIGNDTVAMSGRRTRSAMRIDLTGPRQKMRSLLRIGPALGWVLIVPLGMPSPSMTIPLTFAWLVILTAPSGYWLGRSGTRANAWLMGAVMAAALGAIYAISWAFGVAQPSGWELMAVTAGLAIGWGSGSRSPKSD